MTTQSAKNESAATLPAWNLDDLYPTPDGPELTGDLATAEAAARQFREHYHDRLADLDGTAFGAAIAAYESIDETLSRIMSYAQLSYSGNVSDQERARFYQTTQERVTAISSELLFFTLEINRIDDDVLGAKLEEPTVARYAPWLRDIRAFRPYQLSEEAERLLHEKQVVGRAAWNRLFDETMAGLRFPVDGEQLTSEEALHLLTDPQPAKRRAASKSFGTVLGEHGRTFAMVTNTLAKDKEIEDRWRAFSKPQSARNLSNHVEDDVVDALVASVVGAYPELAHRYYALKARWFGVDRLDYWDRNAPLPESDDRVLSWESARSIVLGAYGGFSPELADIGQRFFDNAWIDAEMREGKRGGAFAHPTVPSVHPYLLVNFQGKTRDVMTLAHELGHGVHQVLAAPRGQLMADTPLTLAETASVFGEMLTFRALVGAEDDPGRRKVMLASKVEDMLNTVVRQIGFYEFELAVHSERQSSELSVERLCDIWLEVQARSLGPSIRLDDEYKWYWAYIPHFVHAPFYVYAYAFGDCLVNSLYSIYENVDEGFVAKYLDMLRAGGTLRHKELLAPFGLDASDPAFWSRGLGVIAGLIDDLEAMG